MSWLSVSSDSVPSVLSEVAVEVSGSGDIWFIARTLGLWVGCGVLVKRQF